MNREDWIIKINDPGFKTTLDVYIFRPLTGHETETLTGQIIKAGERLPPTLELTRGQLQIFADALSEQGFKPKEGFIEGKLEATEQHLSDMRKLVFKAKS